MLPSFSSCLFCSRSSSKIREGSSSLNITERGPTGSQPFQPKQGTNTTRDETCHMRYASRYHCKLCFIDTSKLSSRTTVVGASENSSLLVDNNNYALSSLGGIRADEFKAELYSYYAYIPDLELYQRTLEVDDVSPGDVEAGMRKRYDRQIGIIAIQGVQEDGLESTAELRNTSAR